MLIERVGIATTDGEADLGCAGGDKGGETAGFANELTRVHTRIAHLARQALEECLGGQKVADDVPLLVASCNGGFDEFAEKAWQRAFDSTSWLPENEWNRQRRPVVSGSCASGLQALYLAGELLEYGTGEAIVLAVDAASPANESNFRSLRILSQLKTPWQPGASGCRLGEAAVAVKVKAVSSSPDAAETRVRLGSGGELAECLRHLTQPGSPREISLIVGQGTGPQDADRTELAAIGSIFPLDVPITSPVPRLGHTLGASGLLSVALSWRLRTDRVRCLEYSGQAVTGRPLWDKGYRHLPATIVTTCRALSGATAVALVGGQCARQTEWRPEWEAPLAPRTLFSEVLRSMQTDAPKHRPKTPPRGLVVRLDEPLVLPRRAFLSGRPLPSAVLEITPGIVPEIVAGAWGYRGPSLCLVGPSDPALSQMLTTQGYFTVHVTGSGDDRAVSWEGA